MVDPTLFYSDKPVATRDGRAAVIVTSVAVLVGAGYYFPIIATVEDPSESSGWSFSCYMMNGQCNPADPCNGNDLVNVESH